MARPSGTVTFLFTDVEGSTAAWDTHHSAMSMVQARHDEIVRIAIERENGYIFSTGGDGVAAAFQSARSAVSAAVEMQRAFASELWPPPLQVRVRMGMNTGEAIERDGDYFGPAVIKAARLMSLVGGGRVVCSAFTAGLVKVHLADGLELLPVGTVPLKGLSQDEPAFVIAGPGLIEQGTPLEAGFEERTPPRHNLPLRATPLIDSGDRLGSVQELVLNHRLVTLSGAGGVGKTRLAVELGWSCLDQFDAGAWLVELVPVTNADTVVAAVASTLSIRQQRGLTVIESMVDWFHGRELILIVDNCEHVLDAVRQLVGVLLARCPTVKVVATSREPLGLAGEHVYSVNVLSPEVDGVALFLDRAVSADSSFSSSGAERDSVVDICRRLDGLPLAIELAAARVRSIAPVDLLARLDDRFKLLRSGIGQGMGRHEALRTTVEWSYQLLTEPERALFARLSVFAGGFDLRAAEMVCAGGTIDDCDVADLLSSLVDKSMVVVERHPGRTRYKVLETLRQFGEEQLRDAAASDARKRHLRHYLDVAEEADTLFRSAHQVIGAAIFEWEWDNLRIAHESAVAVGDLAQAERLINASYQHAQSVNRVEHGNWAERAIALGTPDRPPSPDTFAIAALWAFSIENAASAEELLLRGVDLALGTDSPGAVLCWAMIDPGEHSGVPDPFARLEAAAAKLDLDREWWVLILLADKAWAAPGSEIRSAHVARLVETADRVRAPTLMAAAALERGHSFISQRPSNFAAALALYTTTLDTVRQCGDLLNEGEALRSIALATVGLHPDGAIETCRNALIKLHEIRYWYRIWHLFESIGLSLAMTGDVEAASVIVGNLEAHHPPFGYEHNLGFRDRALEIVRRHAQVEEWMARGAAMDRYEIIEHALAALQA
jgi:predicted ATPase/class 3 adenylate cyclase